MANCHLVYQIWNQRVIIAVLMLMHLSSNKIDYLRGFETVSYLLEGEFTHEDFLGHRGVLKVDHLIENISHIRIHLQTFNLKHCFKD